MPAFRLWGATSPRSLPCVFGGQFIELKKAIGHGGELRVQKDIPYIRALASSHFIVPQLDEKGNNKTEVAAGAPLGRRALQRGVYTTLKEDFF